MIELTEDQRQTLNAKGTPLQVRDPQSGSVYVLLEADVYERLKSVLDDEGDWPPEERLRLLAESGKRAGWDDPLMSAYDNYDESRRKLCP